MKKYIYAVASLLLMGTVQIATAAGDYNNVPADDAQFKQCVSYANNNYVGGSENSPVAGQTKVVAFCECMWNETPEDFKGSLAKFSESSQGKKTNKTCEKYSNWGD